MSINPCPTVDVKVVQQPLNGSGNEALELLSLSQSQIV